MPTLVVAWLAAPAHARATDEIRVYTVPKERAAQAAPAEAPSGDNPAMPAADIPKSSAHATWTTPITWKELPPNGIRVGNFAINGQDGTKAEAAIFSFRDTVGSELDNVNRWRNELKLPPLDTDKIASEPVTIYSMDGKMYEISTANKSFVAATLPRQGDTWVFKMWGDKDVVTEAVPVFRDFLKTVHITAEPEATPSAPIANDAIANPHGDLTAAEPDAAPPGEAKWTVPANWTESAPRSDGFQTLFSGR